MQIAHDLSTPVLHVNRDDVNSEFALRISFARKLHAAVASMPGVPKNGYKSVTSTSGYHYRRIEDVMTAVKTLMSDAGLLVFPVVLHTEQSLGPTTEKGKEQRITRARVQITITDVDTGYSESTICDGESLVSDDTGTTKAIRSALKHGLCNLLMIGEDDDTTPVPSSSPVPKGKMARPTRSSTANSDHAQELLRKVVSQEQYGELKAIAKNRGLSVVELTLAAEQQGLANNFIDLQSAFQKIQP